MKKKIKKNNFNLKLYIVFILFIVFTLITSVHVSAETIVYEDKIDSNTTIQDDFKLLGLDYSSFHKSKKYLDNPEAYIIAIGETYINDGSIVVDNESKENMQTFIYLYTPFEYEQIKNISFKYSVNNESKTYIYEADGLINPFLYSTSNGLLKVNGFKYKCSKNDKITIQLSSVTYRIKNVLTNNDYINVTHTFNDGLMEENNTDVFEAVCTHNDKTLQIDLQFKSTLIIDEYEAVCVPIYQDDNFINNWSSGWTGEWNALDLYFYNFNFPDSIKIDSVEYAKFSYYYKKYHDYKVTSLFENKTTTDLLETLFKVNEYSNSTKTINVNEKSVTVDFPVFSLENRISSGQFDKYTRIYESYKNNFDYDCSVLIDSTTNVENRKSVQGILIQDFYYTRLDDIQLLELHYVSNGSLYKAKVISEPIQEEDVTGIDVNKDDLPKKESNNFFEELINIFDDLENNEFINWFISNLPNSLYISILIIILIPVFISFIPSFITVLIKLLMRLISLPIKALKTVLRRN